jgi:hypothetical protein
MIVGRFTPATAAGVEVGLRFGRTRQYFGPFG